jgi:hypothetical protein
MTKKNLTSVHIEWHNGDVESICLDEEAVASLKKCLKECMDTTQLTVGDPEYKFLNLKYARTVEIDE